jgi:hypothetical protein
VVPWSKIEGYLGGDNADSVIGFFDLIEKQYLKDAATPQFLS